jgi:hypothetical protein
VTLLAALERICGPARTWEGRCNELAVVAVREALVDGTVMFGFWTSTVAEGVRWTKLPSGHALHSWIRRPDGTAVDPTRFVFEGKAPYVYEGPEDFYGTCGP